MRLTIYRRRISDEELTLTSIDNKCIFLSWLIIIKRGSFDGNEGGGADGLVDDYPELGSDWSVVASRDRNIVIFDALAAVIGLVVAAV